MAAVENEPAAKHATIPVPRRSGKGFIMSFGDDRTCSVSGCTTKLSRYNPAHECANHGRRRQPGT
ncbi:MAG: hypothetical protein JF603_09115 [Acidobacteria bacterium]|nr:hypothetical protein [Acidobacteriota bacterium]